MNWFLSTMAVAALAVSPALAGDAERGRELAEAWCVGCHVVAPDAPGGDAGPPFSEVASRPGENAAALRMWLADPHPPMPNLDLGVRDIEALAAYIESLEPQR